MTCPSATSLEVMQAVAANCTMELTTCTPIEQLIQDIEQAVAAIHPGDLHQAQVHPDPIMFSSVDTSIFNRYEWTACRIGDRDKAPYLKCTKLNIYKWNAGRLGHVIHTRAARRTGLKYNIAVRPGRGCQGGIWWFIDIVDNIIQQYCCNLLKEWHFRICRLQL